MAASRPAPQPGSQTGINAQGARAILSGVVNKKKQQRHREKRTGNPCTLYR